MAEKQKQVQQEKEISFDNFRRIILDDYRIVNESRQASYLGRKEVMTGKAKFGIFGDGKEVAQVALAKQFRKGDFRSGYYRDQTMMMAIGALSLKEFFAQLYADTNLEAEPASGGRQMNGHFANRTIDEEGNWRDLTAMKNSSADVSPTGSQMPRLLGLAYASKIYRENKELVHMKTFSDNGNEIAFGTIGDASTSEGMFFETFNAAGVIQVPMVLSVWDDGHGISVSKEYQTTKESISEVLKGFSTDKNGLGYTIYQVKGWDYSALCDIYADAVEIARKQHMPVLVHVEEMTQPQGHSTSGSHERYKSKERLQWEQDYDCISKMREWLIQSALATEKELVKIETDAINKVKEAQTAAWNEYIEPIRSEAKEVVQLLNELAASSDQKEVIIQLASKLILVKDPSRKEIISTLKEGMWLITNEHHPQKDAIVAWINQCRNENDERYNSHLHCESSASALKVIEVAVEYNIDAEKVDGRVVVKENFDAILNKYPEVLIFGEDLGKIGGVNQGLEGLQQKYGETRVFDTGIRETTIIGQAIGMAMRGLRPIAEIQYLDYVLYALQIMSDDLATLQYRTKGGQKAPVIVRTRGHRLEGIWHSGSPMGMIINALRGMYICVPRNFTIASGFYNTLLKSDDPALVVEPLNSYRLKEKMPVNTGEYCIPLGIPEIINAGSDLTLVTYGSNCAIAMQAIKKLEEMGISVELIDIQTLLPFDLNYVIAESIEKTGKLVVLDEDVPGGASAYILQQILEEQEAYYFLDAEPKTITAQAHRPAYGSDGDYFSKPNREDVFETVYNLMAENDPAKFPQLY